jgi:hypothetical protein
MVLINPQPCAEPVQHLDDLSGALLSEQVDLEIEMITAVGDHSQVVLLINTRLQAKPPPVR